MIASGSLRAIVVREFGNPDVMRLGDIAPLTPSPSQVLVVSRLQRAPRLAEKFRWPIAESVHEAVMEPGSLGKIVLMS